MSNRQIILIPGLGDQSWITKIQNRYVKRFWNTKTRSIHIFSSNWHTQESFQTKSERLETLFQEVSKQGPVEVIGISAGGPLAIWLADSQQSIVSVKTICGKNQNAAGIGPAYSKRAPALIDTVKASEKAVIHQSLTDRLITFRPFLDEVVPVADQRVTGATNKRIYMVGHIISIITAIVFNLPR